MLTTRMQSSNPILRSESFQSVFQFPGSSAMSIQGTVQKTFLALMILMATAFGTALLPGQILPGVPMNVLAIGAAIIGLVLVLIISFNSKLAPALVPVYAAVEGVFLGSVSYTYEALSPGIVMNAVLLTSATAVAMLVSYQTGLIQVSDTFRRVIMVATMGLCLTYVLSMVLGIFGVNIPFIYSASPIGIGFSLLVVGLAALNLVLDFDMVAALAKQGAPRHMEWMGALTILVTLVWLYLEFLRLLLKLSNSSRN